MPWRLLALVVVAACADVEEGAAPPPETTAEVSDTARIVEAASADSIDVVFTRAEAAATVRRPAPTGVEPLRGSLEALLAGPTAEERAAGIESWFSEETADALRSVTVDSAGHAIVDFTDLRQAIPNAASSTGSRLLLVELNGTVFQFPEVRSVEYRMEGSCDLFWDWLQYGCQTVRREGA
jgi:hypothetical protein